MRGDNRGDGMRAFLVLWFGLLLGVGCAPMRYDLMSSPPSLPSMEECAGGERVMPRFAWPREFEAEARGDELTWKIHTRVRGRDAPNDPLPPRCSDCQYQPRRYRGRRVGTQRMLHFQVQPEGESWRAGFTALSRASDETRVFGFAPSVGGVRPTLLFDAQGAIVDVRGGDAMREAAAATGIETDYGEFVRDRSRTTGYVWRRLDGQREVAESTWGLMLGVLHGQALQCRREVHTAGRLPGLAAHSAPMTGDQRIEWLGRKRCGPDEAPRECIVVRISQRVEAAPLLRALQPERPGDGAPRMVTGRLYRFVDVVTEPETLIPHHVKFYESYRIRWERDVPTPAKWNFDRMSWQTYDFRYGSAMGRINRQREADARAAARQAGESESGEPPAADPFE